MLERFAHLLVAGPVITVAAVMLAALLWGLTAVFAGLPFFGALMSLVEGGIGSAFAIEQSLRFAAPLLLTGLCVALPLHAGMVIIGGEGSLVLGGLAAAAAAAAVPEAWSLPVLLLAGCTAGALWIVLSAAGKAWRNVNEAISSLLLVYVAIAILNHMIEGPLRDPASLDKPATALLPDAAMIAALPGLPNLHWGLPIGILLCLACHFFVTGSAPGLALRYAGANRRAADYAGLPTGRIMIAAAAAAGAAAGLAGAFEVAAVHGRANASLAAGYGFAGILVCALARGNILALLPAALLVGAIEAGGGLLQRRYGAPAASAAMMHGLIFLMLVASEGLRSRVQAFRMAANGR